MNEKKQGQEIQLNRESDKNRQKTEDPEYFSPHLFGTPETPADIFRLQDQAKLRVEIAGSILVLSW